MNSPVHQEQIKSIVRQIQAKQLEIEVARKDGAVFSIVKELYLELKALNRTLTLTLEQLNFDPNEVR